MNPVQWNLPCLMKSINLRQRLGLMHLAPVGPRIVPTNVREKKNHLDIPLTQPVWATLRTREFLRHLCQARSRSARRPGQLDNQICLNDICDTMSIYLSIYTISLTCICKESSGCSRVPGAETQVNLGSPKSGQCLSFHATQFQYTRQDGK